MTHPRYVIRRWVREWRIRRLLKYDKWCVYCQCDLDRIPNSPRQLTLDHWIPKSRGGSNRLKNLVLACAVCNRRKGAMPAFDYIATQSLQSRRRSIWQERVNGESSSGS